MKSIKKILLTIIITISVFILAACSASTESAEEIKQEEQTQEEQVTQKETADTLYIDEIEFEQPSEENSGEEIIEEVNTTPVTMYVVQIGAFSTLDKAESFADNARNRLSQDVIVNYDDVKMLYVVQLMPVATKTEAESTRNDLWKIDTFKDAFIVTIEQ